MKDRKPPASERCLIRTRDAAKVLCMSEWTVRRLALEGEIAYIKLPGLRTPFLFDPADLQAWIDRNRMQATAR